MTTYPTPNSIRGGETKPFPYDWTTRLLDVGAVSLVSSAWDLVSGDVVLGAESMGAVTTAVNVTGGTVDTDSVLSNSVVTNLGSRLVEQWHLFTVAGAWDEDASPYFYGAGAAGLDAAGVSLLPSVLADSPAPRDFPVTLATQKLYLAYPEGWADPVVYLSGFPVPMMATRTVVISGSNYTVLESVSLMVWTLALFQVRAS